MNCECGGEILKHVNATQRWGWDGQGWYDVIGDDDVKDWYFKCEGCGRKFDDADIEEREATRHE